MLGGQWGLGHFGSDECLHWVFIARSNADGTLTLQIMYNDDAYSAGHGVEHGYNPHFSRNAWHTFVVGRHFGPPGAGLDSFVVKLDGVDISSGFSPSISNLTMRSGTGPEASAYESRFQFGAQLDAYDASGTSYSEPISSISQSGTAVTVVLGTVSTNCPAAGCYDNGMSAYVSGTGTALDGTILTNIVQGVDKKHFTATASFSGNNSAATGTTAAVANERRYLTNILVQTGVCP